MCLCFFLNPFEETRLSDGSGDMIFHLIDLTFMLIEWSISRAARIAILSAAKICFTTEYLVFL